MSEGGIVDKELVGALDGYGSDPCAACGKPLGTSWAERLRADGERLEKVHLRCQQLGGQP